MAYDYSLLMDVIQLSLNCLFVENNHILWKSNTLRSLATDPILVHIYFFNLMVQYYKNLYFLWSLIIGLKLESNEWLLDKRRMVFRWIRL